MSTSTVEARVAEKVAIIQKMRKDLGLGPMDRDMAENLARIAIDFIDERERRQASIAARRRKVSS